MSCPPPTTAGRRGDAEEGGSYSPSEHAAHIDQLVPERRHDVDVEARALRGRDPLVTVPASASGGYKRRRRSRVGRGQSENLFEQVLEFLSLCSGEAFQALAERVR